TATGSPGRHAEPEVEAWNVAVGIAHANGAVVDTGKLRREVGVRWIKQAVGGTELVDDHVAFLVDDADLDEVKRSVGRSFTEGHRGRLARGDDGDDRRGASDDPVRLTRVLGQAVA